MLDIPPRKLGVGVGTTPRKLGVPVSYLLRCQKLGLTIWHHGAQGGPMSVRSVGRPDIFHFFMGHKEHAKNGHFLSVLDLVGCSKCVDNEHTRVVHKDTDV